jgi:hypothetical protein
MSELDGPDEAAPPTGPEAEGAAAGSVRRTLWRHEGPATFMYALMPTEVPIAAALLFGSVFLTGFTAVVYNVNQVSFRQAITPLEMQGRMNATMRFPTQARDAQPNT